MVVGDGVPGARPDLGEGEAGGEKEGVRQKEDKDGVPDEDVVREREQPPVASGLPTRYASARGFVFVGHCG
jgi:hypothetical protein